MYENYTRYQFSVIFIRNYSIKGKMKCILNQSLLFHACTIRISQYRDLKKKKKNLRFVQYI